MNLLFYSPIMGRYGGIERHICSLASVAAENGHYVRLLTTSNSLGEELRHGLRRSEIILRELPIAQGHAPRWRKLLWIFCEVLSARKVSWDIIYTNGQSAISRYVWLAKRDRCRIIHHHHTAADSDEQKTWSKSFRQVLKNAPELIACSQTTRALLSRALHRTSISFLPYLTQCPITHDAIKNRLPSIPQHFGFVGRLIPEKGIDAIISLANDASLEHIRWHIHGEGSKYPAKRFESHSRIQYHGAYKSVAEYAQLLSALDAVVLFSTHNEGMPLSLIEAMSAGLPWVATNQGGTNELGLSPSNHILLPAFSDNAELANGVKEMSRRLSLGITSRIEQRRVYDLQYSPSAVISAWAKYLGLFVSAN